MRCSLPALANKQLALRAAAVTRHGLSTAVVVAAAVGPAAALAAAVDLLAWVVLAKLWLQLQPPVQLMVQLLQLVAASSSLQRQAGNGPGSPVYASSRVQAEAAVSHCVCATSTLKMTSKQQP
jgi:class 3 adenylate cyclase